MTNKDDAEFSLTPEDIDSLALSNEIAEPKSQISLFEPLGGDLVRLYEAKRKAQQDKRWKIVPRNKKNEFHRSTYTTYSALVRHITPILLEYDLVVAQQTAFNEEGKEVLITSLIHSPSLGFERSFALIDPFRKKKVGSNEDKAFELVSSGDIQDYGSYLKYKMRYQYCLITGGTPSDNDDDDGERHMRNNSPARKISGLSGALLTTKT